MEWASQPVSQGASGYHNVVINASWNMDNLDILISMMEPEIKENDVIVDFGAGTGASAISILQKINKKIHLCLVDNSPAWLAKAHELLRDNHEVAYFVLEKKNDSYETLDQAIGKNAADMVISANTLHLIPDIEETFYGISKSLKKRGIFIFQSGNIIRNGRPKDILMIEDTIHEVHDHAIEIINSSESFRKYRKDIETKIESGKPQRNLIFPRPRQLDIYMAALNKAAFIADMPIFRTIKVKYTDWLNFLRVKRLQAGILSEIGGRYPTPEEEKDRDAVIVLAANKLFERLRRENSLADDKTFTVEWIYVRSVKK